MGIYINTHKKYLNAVSINRDLKEPSARIYKEVFIKAFLGVIIFHSTNGCFSLISFNKSTFDTQPSPIKASCVYSFTYLYSSYSSFVKSSKDIS